MHENGMVEPASVQDRREREEKKGYNLFADPDYLFEVATELAREQAVLIFNEDDPRLER
jgi:hypothetical protein